jgi:hypothetical protein
MGESGDRRFRRFKFTCHTSATENLFTKSDLMKAFFLTQQSLLQAAALAS